MNGPAWFRGRRGGYARTDPVLDPDTCEVLVTDQATLSKEPTPDTAEHEAYFPSPYSLDAYTAPRTDFDGLATERHAWTGGRWKILVLATDERYLLMGNGTMFSTGNHPVETLLPLHHVLGAGFGVEIATLTGNPAKFEWWAYPSEDEAVRSTRDALLPQWRKPKSLADVVEHELGPDSDYLGVFVPGGHGALSGLPFSTDVRDTLEWATGAGRLVVSLCHGPAAFLSTRIGRERSLFEGYEMCVFPDALDAGANVDIGYLPGPMPWMLGRALQDDGVRVVNDDMSGRCTTDRDVITGDSPLAANELGRLTATAMLAKARELG
ncbi:Chaperone protein hchA [Pseudonocardia sp. Ae168_Ps1]|nr:Chaperone protein hchA [Pseudonocardia sp. Ae150A_Ps1]OLL77734.1 Chaperone protein hchA [Pseudonocardia sp. Ae168_Ps1]OLL88143.1 Chaperone protein hchA [Pseudonocardia sp. Ae263_Ps1]OLL91831.1 Chaperone protein hchA [Pseudonocardia sp. Ae356_Ps1]